MHDFNKENKTKFAFVVILALAFLLLVFNQSSASATPDCDLYPDTSWCSGPSMKECPQGVEVPETEDCNSYSNTDCEDWERSARGYCPGEPGHQEEIDGLYDDTHSCEQDGTCDDSCSPPARDDCLEGEFDWLECQDDSEPDEHNMCPVPDFERALPLTKSVDELPRTGISEDWLVILALVSTTAGIAILGVTRSTKRIRR